MRFHVSSNVNRSTIDNAAKVAGVDIVTATEHGSRTHDKAFDIKVSGSSARNSQNGEYRAATFDEWGVFIEMLYRSDPTMYVAGTYFDYHHFVWTYADRYAQIVNGTAKPHKQHKWNYQGTSLTGTYSVQMCKCGATLRRVTVRHSANEKAVDAWHRLTSVV